MVCFFILIIGLLDCAKQKINIKYYILKKFPYSFHMNKLELERILSKTTPAFFGLGFIQCKINQYERVHFYHPKLTPTVNIEEEVHNHRYDFESTILSGQIVNKKYKFIENKNNPTHFLQNESCNESVEAKNTVPIYGQIVLDSNDCIIQGHAYLMKFDEFHTFSTTKCITYLKRSDYKQEFAQVVRPLNSEIICPFSIKLSQQDCWDIIKDCLLEF
jgi:hypothetical protein